MKKSLNNYTRFVAILCLSGLVGCGFSDDPLEDRSENTRNGGTDVETQKVTPIYTNSNVRLKVFSQNPAFVFDIDQPTTAYELEVESIGDLSQYGLSLDDVNIEMVRGPLGVKFDPSQNKLTYEPIPDADARDFFSENARFRLSAVHKNFIFETFDEVPLYFRGNGGKVAPVMVLNRNDRPVAATQEMDVTFGSQEARLTLYVHSFDKNATGSFIAPDLHAFRIMPNGSKRPFNEYRMTSPPSLVRSTLQSGVFSFSITVDEIHIFEERPVVDTIELEFMTTNMTKAISNQLLVHGAIGDIEAPIVYLPQSLFSEPLSYSDDLLLVYPVEWRGDVDSSEMKMETKPCAFTDTLDPTSLDGFNNSCVGRTSHGVCSLAVTKPVTVDPAAIYCIEVSTTLTTSSGRSVTGKNVLFFNWN